MDEGLAEECEWKKLGETSDNIMGQGWKWKKLGEVSDIIMGQSPAGETYNKTGNGMPFLQGKAEFTDSCPKHIIYTTNPSKVAPEGSILISVRAPVGDVNIANLDYCIGRGLASISLKNGDNKFLFYLLRYLKPEIESKGTGSTFKAISKSVLNDLSVPLPPLETQQKIVSILEKAEETKKLRAQADELTQQLIQSVFLEMFGNFEKNPYNWKITSLEKICEKITDGTHRKPKYVDVGIPFLSVKNITQGYFDFSDVKYITEEEHKELIKRCKPEKNEILYTKVGVNYGIAEVINVEEEFSIYVSLALLKPKFDIVNPYYLKFALNSHFVKKQANKRIRGIGVPDLHLIEIKKFKIPLPPLEFQERFEFFVKQFRTLNQNQQKSFLEINTLFDALMQKAFTGELVL